MTSGGLPSVLTLAVITCSLSCLSDGKIPPTLPVCPEEEELKVLECQRRLNSSLVSSLPEGRAFFTGVMQATHLSRVCEIITHYFACGTSDLGFCRRVRPTPPPTDYFFMSLANFCYNGAFNDYPTMFLCYQSASRQTSSCYASFQTSSSRAVSRDRYCRLYSSLIDCVSQEIRKLCGPEAVKLVEPLLGISVPTSAFCTSDKFMKYVVSMQADQLVAGDSSGSEQFAANDGSLSVPATSSVGLAAMIGFAVIVQLIQISPHFVTQNFV